MRRRIGRAPGFIERAEVNQERNMMEPEIEMAGKFCGRLFQQSVRRRIIAPALENFGSEYLRLGQRPEAEIASRKHAFRFAGLAETFKAEGELQVRSKV
jgi:hypothetical protein